MTMRGFARIRIIATSPLRAVLPPTPPALGPTPNGHGLTRPYVRSNGLREENTDVTDGLRMSRVPQTELRRKCSAALRRHLRVRVVDSTYRLSRTGLPSKPYDGSDATVSGLSDADPEE